MAIGHPLELWDTNEAVDAINSTMIINTVYNKMKYNQPLFISSADVSGRPCFMKSDATEAMY